MCVICVHKIEYPATSGPTNNEPIDAPGRLPDGFYQSFCSSNPQESRLLWVQLFNHHFHHWAENHSFEWLNSNSFEFHCTVWGWLTHHVWSYVLMLRCEPMAGSTMDTMEPLQLRLLLAKLRHALEGSRAFHKKVWRPSSASHEPKERLIAWLGWWREGLLNGYWRDLKSVHEFSND